MAATGDEAAARPRPWLLRPPRPGPKPSRPGRASLWLLLAAARCPHTKRFLPSTTYEVIASYLTPYYLVGRSRTGRIGLYFILARHGAGPLLYPGEPSRNWSHTEHVADGVFHLSSERPLQRITGANCKIKLVSLVTIRPPEAGSRQRPSTQRSMGLAESP